MVCCDSRQGAGVGVVVRARAIPAGRHSRWGAGTLALWHARVIHSSILTASRSPREAGAATRRAVMGLCGDSSAALRTQQQSCMKDQVPAADAMCGCACTVVLDVEKTS